MLPLAIAAASHEFLEARTELAVQGSGSIERIAAHVLPASFKAAQFPLDEAALMSLPDKKLARLDFQLFDKASPTAVSIPPPAKIAGRAEQAPEIRRSDIAIATGQIARPVNMPAYHAANLQILESDSDIAAAPAPGKTQTFRRATAIGPNLIKADGVTIELAGISPPDGHATCKRIDGLVQPCTERAQHRLAILLQARHISCTIVQRTAGYNVKARCKAGNIDLASDLLRSGLAQRAASRTMASIR